MVGLAMTHDALVLSCGHVVEGQEWTRGSQVAVWCPEHQERKPVVGRSEDNG